MDYMESLPGEYEPPKKSRKGILIALLVVVIVAAIGVAVYLLVFKNASSPESVAKRDIDASVEKDWKSIIKDMTDDEFQLIFEIEMNSMRQLGLSSAKELRSWALQHASELTDPASGREIRDVKIGKTINMSTSEFIDGYMGSVDNKAFSDFLNKAEEFALVQFDYVMVISGQDYDRSDAIMLYKRNGKWHSLTGVEIVDEMIMQFTTHAIPD